MALTLVKGNIIEDGGITSGQLVTGSVTSGTIQDNTITNVKMAVDPTNASNLNAGDVPVAQLGNAPATDTTTLQDDIALLGFKAAANGSLAKYNLVDQTVDAFEDASGVDASSSTNEYRESTGKYYSGTLITANPESFTANGTYNNPAGITTVTYLVVAGGGGGGHNIGGGGGAGGYRTGDLAVTASTAYPVTVGAGGAGSTGAPTAASGTDSTFSTITSAGGGGGGSRPTPGTAGSGGSGGGGASDSGTGGAGNTPSTTPSQGFPGGTSTDSSGRGGGGAGETPTDHLDGGGDGLSNSISGSAVYYAGGGGSGGSAGSPPGPGQAGGLGGGGDGGAASVGTVGTANTGGGGGSGNNSGALPGYAGGTGIVIVSYDTGVYTDMTLVSNLTAAQAAPTKGDIVFTYSDGTGTAVINTNITAEISADDGSTWTAFTLTSQGTTGGHTILTSHDQTITSTITSPWNMRYRIKTLVQSAAMSTRIQAVSLGWS